MIPHRAFDRRLGAAVVSCSIAVCLGCSASTEKPAVDTALVNPATRHDSFEATLRVLDEHPHYVDELFAEARQHHRELDGDPYCTPGLRAYQTLMEKDRGARLRSQERLRALRREHGGEVTIVCSHDPVEFERASGAPAGVSMTAPSMLSPADAVVATAEIE